MLSDPRYCHIQLAAFQFLRTHASFLLKNVLVYVVRSLQIPQMLRTAFSCPNLKNNVTNVREQYRFLFLCWWRSDLFITEECHKSDHLGNLPPSFTVAARVGDMTKTGFRRTATVLVQQTLEAAWVARGDQSFFHTLGVKREDWR